MENTERPRSATWIGSALGITQPGELARLLGLMGLFFLVVCAVGILRPIKNALALDGLGATDFYRVYLVSAAVVLFVPAFNRLADRLPWRTLFAAVAMFFAVNLVVFRLLYVDGSALFGLLFYGWYDLFAAALVTQFFMATQFYFDARSARRAYPIVIAGGSIGATLGGGVTGIFAQRIGTPNLLIVAAVLIAIFAVGIPWVLKGGAERPRQRDTAGAGGIRELLGHRQVRLIAGAVLMTVVVKQLVDYQFNALTKEVFESRDAISAFQGKFNAATQWLPLIVLAGLRPALRRWGVGAAVLLLPVLMFGAVIGLAVTFSLAAAVVAKGADMSLRYSADRAGREILYVPVPDEIKLRAKAWIDVAIEKGLGKVAAALLIMALLTIMDLREIAWVTVVLAAGWVVFALAIRREYVRTLARAVEGRFASLGGVFASLVDATTLPLLRDALHHPEPMRAAFGLELVEQLPDRDVPAVAAELNELLRHEREQIRLAAARQLMRAPAHIDIQAARLLLDDPAEELRAQAVSLLMAASGERAPRVLHELLTDQRSDIRRGALLAVLGNGHRAALHEAGAAWATARQDDDLSDPEVREERALAAAALGDDAAYVTSFLDDPDPRVRAAALRSAALLGRVDCCGRMIAALGDSATRAAARAALANLGPAALEPLEHALMDTDGDPLVRRAVPAVLARIPAQQTVDAMLRLVLAPETDQLLDYRTIRALGQLRAHHPNLTFDSGVVFDVAEAESRAAARYAAASYVMTDLRRETTRAGATSVPGAARAADLLDVALREAWLERREAVFRCIAMVHDPDAVRRAYAAVSRGRSTQRATAIEWVEQTIGSSRFRRLDAVLEPEQAARAHVTLPDLAHDADPYIATLAGVLTRQETDGMELIEKVFLLQQVDLLRDARGAHVALLASIAQEIEAAAGTVIIPAGEVASAMFVVTRGAVELRGVGHHLVVGPEHAFGTWALIDDEPIQVEARAVEHSRLLRVTRDDFHDLLADHPEIGIGMLRGLARRMRALVA
jgi:ATP:ADP antiporter, AAA family